MKAEAESINFLGQAGAIKIPFFQRKYVWTEDNWKDLLDELLLDKTHFLGSIILKQQSVASGKQKETLVIDGQQRLTTLSILLKVLFNSFDEKTRASCQKYIDTILYYKAKATSESLLVKITHSKVDRKFFELLMKDQVLSITDRSGNILKCFDWYTNAVAELTAEQREDLFNNLVDPNDLDENSILVVIDLTDSDDEQAIFDTINSSGVRLTSADIIKNALFQKAFEIMENTVVEELFENVWERTFALDTEAVEFWDRKYESGRHTRDATEVLLHGVASIRGFFDPEKNALTELATLYKNYIKKMNEQQLVTFIIEIGEYGKLYREKMLEFDASHLFDYAECEERLFHVLAVNKFLTFHPYILYLYKKHENDKKALKTALGKLERFIMRRMIAGAETRAYVKYCKEFIQNETRIDNALLEIRGEQVVSALKGSISNKDATLILFWVELYRRHNDNCVDKDSLKYCYSLEHIMPQDWKKHWSIKAVPVIDDNGQIIEDEEQAKTTRAQQIYTIGNMTLLKGALNSSLKNYDFERKIEGVKGTKNYIRKLAELGITKHDIVDPYDKGDKVWNESKIRNRTQKIIDDVLKMWN